MTWQAYPAQKHAMLASSKSITNVQCAASITVLPIAMMTGRFLATSGACAHSRGPNLTVAYPRIRSINTQGRKAMVSARPGG